MNGQPPTDRKTTVSDQTLVDIVLLYTDMDMLLSSTNYSTMGMHMTTTNVANNQDRPLLLELGRGELSEA